MLDPVRLRLLRDLAEHGTMTAVAELSGMTSSAVSQQLATLQREAGLQLFERVGRRVRLTVEGLRLLGHAHAVLGALDAAEHDLRAGSAPRGPVRVACFATAAAGRLLPAMTLARQRYPELQIIVLEHDPHEAMRVLRAGGCELAITFSYNLIPEPPPQAMRTVALGTEPILLALPAHDATPSPVELAGLRQAHWIAGAEGTSDYEMLHRACAGSDFSPHVVHTADDYDLVLRMVAAGLGVALVPEVVRAVVGIPDGVLLRPIATTITRSTQVSSRAGTPARDAVLRLLSEQAG